ncbi:MAG: HAMP domain-containing histidine kinase [Oscillospiraceae bacterium]|jgi:signal transduction histidine kinase|nr:HAMP domain-containing histidine kinase [Oscillospiraceae bacterium]
MKRAFWFKPYKSVGGSPDRSLRRLGWKLTLLNAAVSGVILVAITVSALSVAERTLGKQYERELALYARSIIAAVRVVSETGEPMTVQVPEQYRVFMEKQIESASRPLQIITMINDGEPGSGGGASVRIIAHAEPAEPSALPSELSSELPSDLPSDLSSALPPALSSALQSALSSAPPFETPVTPEVLSSERAQEGGTLVGSINILTYLLDDSGNVPYRVTTMPLGVGGSVALIGQQRTEEIIARTRLRWIFAALVAFGLAVITVCGRLLAKRSIRPIEESIARQRAFIAAASHELRTPVAAIGANADALSDAPLGEFSPFLSNVRDGCSRLARLVSDMIDLARADAGEMGIDARLTDAADAARRAVSWIRPLAVNENITIIEMIEPVALVADDDRLHQVFLALLDNALRYTREGGSVAVETRRDGADARLRVADTGIGVPDDEKERVFDRFHRLDAARSSSSGGAGLGLSVARQLVEGMGGSISLRDNDGGGTVVEIRFRAAGQ